MEIHRYAAQRLHFSLNLARALLFINAPNHHPFTADYCHPPGTGLAGLRSLVGAERLAPLVVAEEVGLDEAAGFA